MRLLICRLSSLGDVASAVPAVWQARQSLPDAHIAWAVDPRFADVARACPAVNEVIVVKPGMLPRTWPTFAEPFDAVLDLQGLLKSAIVAKRSGARIGLGYHWQREGASLATRPVIPDARSIHIVDQYVDVARALAAEAGANPNARIPSPPLLVPSPEATQSLETTLRQRGSAGVPYVVLNPGAGWATKRWPAASFAKVVDALWDRGLTPVAIGGKANADRSAYEEVASLANRPPVSLTGQTSVGELVALLAGARAHVGGDTGSSHIAAMLGVPAIGLYSITLPARSCPYLQAARCLWDPVGLDRIPPRAVLDLLERA